MGKVKKTCRRQLVGADTSPRPELWLHWRRNAENFDPLVPALVGNQSRGGTAPHVLGRYVGGGGRALAGLLSKEEKVTEPKYN